MPRKLRIQYPGAIYHVMNRGDRREAIFADAADYQLFLATLGEACQKTGWQIHAYCLMANHFHTVLETPQPNLVEGMKWFLGTYTSRFNRRHKEFGHLFSGRYKSLVVDGSGNGYLKTVCDYVHLNPARAGLLEPSEPLEQFAWSSYPQYLQSPAQRPAWLRVDRVLGEWRIPKDSLAGRREFARRMEGRRQEADANEFTPMQRGWCLGDEEFRRELLEQVEVGPPTRHDGEAAREAVQVQAERKVQAGMRKLKWTEADLAAARKGDQRKLKLALELQATTTLPLTWIAERLKMGTRGYLTWLLQQRKVETKQAELKLI